MFSFYVKFVQTDRQTDRQTDGQTDRQTDRQTTVKQYAPDLSIQGHKKTERSHTIAINLGFIVQWFIGFIPYFRGQNLGLLGEGLQEILRKSPFE